MALDVVVAWEAFFGAVISVVVVITVHPVLESEAGKGSGLILIEVLR